MDADMPLLVQQAYAAARRIGFALTAGESKGSGSAEIDPRRAAAAREMFAGDPRVTVITGESFPAISRHGPYDLLFSDGGGGQAELVGLLAAGGRVVMDDLTPTALLPPGSPFLGADDPKRGFFASPRLVSTEIVLPDLRNALLVGTLTSARSPV
jgi:predicted O-methyltransferase YrrM